MILRRTITISLAAALLTIIFWAEIPEYNECVGLRSRGLHVNGKVTALTPDQHDTYRYAYVVDSIRYEGVAFLNRLPRRAFVGESIDVLYDPHSPSISRTDKREISDCFSNHLGAGLLFAAIIIVVSGLAFIDAARFATPRDRLER